MCGCLCVMAMRIPENIPPILLVWLTFLEIPETGPYIQLSTSTHIHTHTHPQTHYKKRKILPHTHAIPSCLIYLASFEANANVLLKIHFFSLRFKQVANSWFMAVTKAYWLFKERCSMMCPTYIFSFNRKCQYNKENKLCSSNNFMVFTSIKFLHTWIIVYGFETRNS